ncbi:MAG: hypothetical protein KGI25_03900 [Thaumarchaeota archaeon]|nr:hypothetical protein [Nitrososphaerota archaeon]
MKFQCTFCDKSSKSEYDPKFTDCYAKKHQIVRMLEQKEIRDATKDAEKARAKVSRSKVKGHIGDLYVESILIESKPYFLCVAKENNTLSTMASIETEDTIYKPLSAEQCGYFPYTFASSELVHLNDSISKAEILDDIKNVIDRYVSARDLDKHLIQGDILLTYCQEWISTVHYPYFVGETESGKSTVLHLAKWLCYRCHYGEDIPTADIYNFLGTDEEGTGTIGEDEAQEIWRNKDKIRMYKNSYAKGSMKARIIGVDSLGKHQVYYRTFCPKWFAGERVPYDKGFVERIAIIPMTEGQPVSNIKRVSKDEGEQLNQIRNRLLVWKLQNISKGLTTTDSGLKQRDKELWSDFVASAVGTKYHEKFLNVANYYLEQRHAVIRGSLEARLMKLLLDKLDPNLELKFEEYWNYLTQDNPEFPGKLDTRSEKSFYSDDYPETITYHLLSKILSEKFQAVRREAVVRDDAGAKHKITSYVFKKEVLEKLIPKYGIELPIGSPLHVGQLGVHGGQEDDKATQVDQVNQVKGDGAS